MAVATAAAIVGAVAAVAGATAAGVSAHNQNMASKRAARNAANVADKERERQRKADTLLAEQEKTQSQETAGILRATAGKRAGRRSLLSGSELGTQETLG